MRLRSKLIVCLAISILTFTTGELFILAIFRHQIAAFVWTLLVLSGMGIVSIYLVTKQLSDLLSDVQAIRYGFKDVLVGAEFTDELGLLACEFNKLHTDLSLEGNKIARADAMVEQKVWHRTKDLHKALKRMEITATTDGLSGLANRGQLKQQSQQTKPPLYY